MGLPGVADGCPGERLSRFAFPDGSPSLLASRANGRNMAQNGRQGKWPGTAIQAHLPGLAEGGRGVFLMRELSDDIAFSDGGRRVVLTLSSRP